MPTIDDNTNSKLLDRLLAVGQESYRADSGVCYFSLAGWRSVAGLVEQVAPEGTDWPCESPPGEHSKPRSSQWHKLDAVR